MKDPPPVASSSPNDSDQTLATARLLQQRGGSELFVYLAMIAVDGRWDSFTSVVAALGDISTNGVEVLLEAPAPSVGWRHLYNSIGLPSSLFNAFITIIEISRKPIPTDDRRRHQVVERTR